MADDATRTIGESEYGLPVEQACMVGFAEYSAFWMSNCA